MSELLIEAYIGASAIVLAGIDDHRAVGYRNEYLAVLPAEVDDAALGTAILEALRNGARHGRGRPPEPDERLRLEKRLLVAAGVRSRTALAREYASVTVAQGWRSLRFQPSYVDKPSQGYLFSAWLEDERLPRGASAAAIGEALRRAVGRCMRSVPRKPAAGVAR